MQFLRYLSVRIRLNKKAVVIDVWVSVYLSASNEHGILYFVGRHAGRVYVELLQLGVGEYQAYRSHGFDVGSHIIRNAVILWTREIPVVGSRAEWCCV